MITASDPLPPNQLRPLGREKVHELYEAAVAAGKEDDARLWAQVSVIFQDDRAFKVFRAATENPLEA